MEKDIFGEHLPQTIEYKPFDGQEAAEIIIPTEVNLSFSKNQQAKKSFSPSELFGKFLDFAENIGEFYVSLLKYKKSKLKTI